MSFEGNYWSAEASNNPFEKILYNHIVCFNEYNYWLGYIILLMIIHFILFGHMVN